MKLIWFIGCLATIIKFVSSVPIPHNGMIYYQAPMYYSPYRQPIRHAMLLHYNDHEIDGGPMTVARNRPVSSESSGVTAFASGDTIAAGTYLKDTNPSVNQQPNINVLPYESQSQTDDETITSIAESVASDADDVNADIPYDEQQPQHEQSSTVNEIIPHDSNVDLDDFADTSDVVIKKQKTPKQYLPPAAPPLQPIEPVSAEHDDNTSVVPKQPINHRKKKVRVALDAEDDDDEYVNTRVRPNYPNYGASNSGGGANTGSSSNNNNNGQWPYGTFFPMNFGSTSGGAIAVANSFSTGKGGTATSHATAYGSPPSKQRTRKRLIADDQH